MGKNNKPIKCEEWRQRIIIDELINGHGGGYSFKKNGCITTDYIGLLPWINTLVCNIALKMLYYFCIKNDKSGGIK